MPELDPVSLVKALDSPWQPGDANVAPIFADQMQTFWEVAHERIGAAHKLPAASAAAIAEWTGSTYVVVASAGIASVVRTTVGTLEVILTDSMATPYDWIATARGFDSKAEVEGADIGEPTGSKTQSRTYVRLFQKVGSEQATPIDVSVIIEVFGVPL